MFGHPRLVGGAIHLIAESIAAHLLNEKADLVLALPQRGEKTIVVRTPPCGSYVRQQTDSLVDLRGQCAVSGRRLKHRGMAMDTKDDNLATMKAKLKPIGDAASKNMKDMAAAHESVWQRMQAGMDPVWASMQNAWEQLRIQFKK